jgi:hypothetical protein
MLTVDELTQIHNGLAEEFGVGEEQDVSVIGAWCERNGIDLDVLITIVGHETMRVGEATNLDPTNPGDHETIAAINAACIEAFMTVFTAGRAVGARDASLDGLDFEPDPDVTGESVNPEEE